MADPYEGLGVTAAPTAAPSNDPYAGLGVTAPSTSTPTLASGPRNTQASMVSNPPPAQTKGVLDRITGGIDKASQFASDTISNVPSDALEVGKGVVNALAHPVDTAKTLGSLAGGFISKTGRPGDFVREGDAGPTPEELQRRAQVEGPANALAAHYAEAYGSVPKAFETLRTHPVSTALDISTVAAPVGSVLAKAPGLVGKAGEAVQTVGRAVDPLTTAGEGAKVAGKIATPVVSEPLGFTSGMGARSVRDIPSAGRQSMVGGEQGAANAAAVRENMRGASPENVVERGKSALASVKADAGAEYRSGMLDISKDKTILDFGDINKGLDKANNVGKFKGANIEPKATAINDELGTIVKDWETLNPKSPLFKDVPEGELTPQNFHTPEGLDALKRTVGNIYGSTLPHTPERVAAGRIYNAIKAEIVQQAPTYAKVMEKYDTALDKFNEASRTFSLGEKATGDTAARKLLSATRPNVQTNFGGREKLMDMLAEHDPSLPYAIAGQAANSLLPRGIVARGGVMGAGLTGGLTGMLTNPLSALAIPAFMPRVIGEAGYYGGKGVGALELAGRKAGVTPDRLRALEQLGYLGNTTETEIGKRGGYTFTVPTRNALVR